MKRNTLILPIFLIALVLFGVYLMTRKDETQIVDLPKEELVQISDTEKSILKDDEVVSVKILYPEISGLSYESGEKVNTFLEKEMDRVVVDFVSNSYPIAPGSAAEKNQMQSLYKVHEISSGYLSVVFEMWESYSGAAHGNPYTLSYTFDTKTGELLALRDFFNEGTQYLKVLSDESRVLLKEKLADWYDETWVQTGTEPREENFKNFLPTQNGFKFIFDPYQVAPYAAGKHEIEIGNTILEDYLKK
jgi:hypothetical protein